MAARNKNFRKTAFCSQDQDRSTGKLPADMRARRAYGGSAAVARLPSHMPRRAIYESLCRGTAWLILLFRFSLLLLERNIQRRLAKQFSQIASSSNKRT